MLSNAQSLSRGTGFLEAHTLKTFEQPSQTVIIQLITAHAYYVYVDFHLGIRIN